MDDRSPQRTTDLPWTIAHTPEDLGKFVNTRRVSSGWTQRDLAEHLGFPVRYLHEIESGKDTLAFTRLFDLLRALGIEVRLEAVDPDRDDDFVAIFERALAGED
jgi:HTH-type transcriptional regulator/antitoxin HipB